MNIKLFGIRSKILITTTMMISALLLALALVPNGVAAQTVLGPTDSVAICHAPPGQGVPFVQQSVNVSGILGSDNPGNAHDSHELDIIPPFDYNLGEGVQSYPGKNWDTTGQAWYSNNCNAPAKPAAVLGLVSFQDATCDTVASITMPLTSFGVTYDMSAIPAPGVTVIVSATLHSTTHQWGDTTGWSSTDNPNVYTKSHTYAAQPDCHDTAILGVVTFVDATCNLKPELILPANGNGVTYTSSPEVTPGGTVTVTATIDLATHKWGNTDGWLPNPPGASASVTQSFTFSSLDCRDTAILGPVGFVDATCDDAPSLTLPAGGNGVTYSQDGPAVPGATVVVSATLNTETHVWGTANGWLPNPVGDATVLTQSFAFADPDCEVPGLPAATLGVVAFSDATCKDDPELTLPENGNGVTYTQDKDAKPGMTVVVSATLNSETHQWGSTTGWTSTDDPNVVARSFIFADPDCEVPELPAATLGVIAFSDATCKDDPELTLPEDGNGVAYTQDKDAEPGMTVVVSATLNSETHQWGSTTGWTSTDDPNVVARSFTFADPDCEIPEKPEKSAPPKTSEPAEVSKLPVTGSGSETSNPGRILTITALGAVSLAGAVILGERKRI